MTFKKQLIAASVAFVALGLQSNAFANDVEVTPYGKLSISYQQTDDSSLDGNEIKSNASRFGIKGKSKISDSLTAIYQLEWEIDVADEKDGEDNHLKSRNQFIGLAGGFGEIITGRHDTPLKKSQGKVDLFNDLEGDIKYLLAGEIRTDNIVQYTTPKFAGGLKIKYAMTSKGKGAPESTTFGDHDNNPSTPDIAQTTDIGNANSLSIEWADDKLFLAYAKDSDISGNNTKTSRLTASYKVTDWTFGAIYNEHDDGTIKDEGYIVSVAYKTGDHTLKFQTGESDYQDSNNAVDSETTSIGWDVKLSNNTKFFSFFTSADDADKKDHSWLGFGLEQKF